MQFEGHAAIWLHERGDGETMQEPYRKCYGSL